MSSLKPRRETDLLIKVAAGEPLEAESLLVRSLCDSAKDLPAAAEEWDVSGLLLDGQPFSRETVSCWLRCAYSTIQGLEELSSRDIAQLSTVTGLTQVLAFADAVGSCPGLCRAACSQLQQLKFVVQLPEQVLKLHVPETVYGFEEDTKLVLYSMQKTSHSVAPLASAEQRNDVQQQVASQAAALLRLAHMLRLQMLLDVLQQFMLLNIGLPSRNCLLSGAADLVFTDAVLEAALGSSSLSKEAYVSSVLSLPCSLTPGVLGHSSLLKPIGSPTFDSYSKTLVFEARLLRDFAGAKAGDTVKVTLDLFGNRVATGGATISSVDNSELSTGAGSIWLPVQLLLGRTFPDAAALESLMSTEPQAAPE